MRPAFSIILFTTASGAGYGLLALIGLLAALRALPVSASAGLAGAGLALVLVSVGLLSSTFHLRHPERAWRAVTQWRSSWLSREGAIALITYIPALALIAGLALFGEGAALVRWSGLAAGACALATTFCTGMIYASLKPVREWREPLTVPVYLGLALASGALLLLAIATLSGVLRPWLAALALALLAAAWGLKLIYWRALARTASSPTVESATGLKGLGEVRLLDPPHTETNYLLHEMGYRIARKHARKLRLVALLAGGLAPGAATVSLFWAVGVSAAVLAVLGAALALAGILVERWLFFAEATHTVTLYYGAGRAGGAT